MKLNPDPIIKVGYSDSGGTFALIGEGASTDMPKDFSLRTYCLGYMHQAEVKANMIGGESRRMATGN